MAKRVPSMYQLQTSRWRELAMPRDVFRGRVKEASTYARRHITNIDVKTEYARQFNIVHYNHVKVLEGASKRPLQHVYNFGLPFPTADQDVVREQILSNFQDHVLPKIDKKSKVCVMIGTMMERVEEDGGEPVNVKFFRPDFNSQVNLFKIDSRTQAVEDLRRELGDGSDLKTQLGIQRPDTKYKLVFYTNMKFKIFQGVNPMVGTAKKKNRLERLPDFPEKYKRMLWTPKKRLNDQLCLFRCIGKALEMGDGMTVARKYVAWRKIQKGQNNKMHLQQ